MKSQVTYSEYDNKIDSILFETEGDKSICTTVKKENHDSESGDENIPSTYRFDITDNGVNKIEYTLTQNELEQLIKMIKIFLYK